MNEIRHHSAKTTDHLVNYLSIDKEFIRIFDSIKVKEKLTNDFITLTDNVKIEYLIKAFLVIKKEKENLFNNFIDFEKETKNLETENLVLNKELNLKEEKLIKYKFKIDKLSHDLDDCKSKINDLTARFKEASEEKKKLQETFSTETKGHLYNNQLRLEINNKFNKKDIKINKFLNKVETQTQRKIISDDLEKRVPNCIKVDYQDKGENNFDPIINDLNVEFINFQIQKKLNQNDENFIADYIVKSKTNNENEIEHLELDQNRSETNDKLKSNFASQINQSVSIYESVYESYDNRYNIGEYNSSTYQTVNSSNRNQSFSKKY